MRTILLWEQHRAFRLELGENRSKLYKYEDTMASLECMIVSGNKRESCSINPSIWGCREISDISLFLHE